MTIEAICREPRINVSLPNSEGLTLAGPTSNIPSEVEILDEVRRELEILRQLETLHLSIAEELGTVLSLPASRTPQRPAMGQVWLTAMTTIGRREGIPNDQLSLDSIINEVVNSLGRNNVPAQLLDILARLQSSYAPLRAQIRTSSLPHAQTIINQGNNLAYLSLVETLKRALQAIGRDHLFSSSANFIGLNQIPWGAQNRGQYANAIGAAIERTLTLTQNNCNTYAEAINRARATLRVTPAPVRPQPSPWRFNWAVSGNIGGGLAQGSSGLVLGLGGQVELANQRGTTIQLAYSNNTVFNPGGISPTANDALGFRLALNNLDFRLAWMANLVDQPQGTQALIDHQGGVAAGYRIRLGSMVNLNPFIGGAFGSRSGLGVLGGGDLTLQTGRVSLAARVGGGISLDGNNAHVFVQPAALFRTVGQLHFGVVVTAGLLGGEASLQGSFSACFGAACAARPVVASLGVGGR